MMPQWCGRSELGKPAPNTLELETSPRAVMVVTALFFSTKSAPLAPQVAVSVAAAMPRLDRA